MRMKCGCMADRSSTSYERLTNFPLLEINSLCSPDSDKDGTDEKQEQLEFYNDDNSYQSVVVEKNLCASDLCQLLALKNRVSKDVNWTIVEHWVHGGLERNLEDHEDVLSVHRDMEAYAIATEKRFVFRKDFRKYEFFHNPQQFFPADMVDLSGCDSTLAGNRSTLALQSLLDSGTECPTIFSQVWVRESRQVWAKAFLLLKDKILYLSYKVQVVAKFLRHWKSRENCLGLVQDRDHNVTPVGEEERGQLQVFARLSEFNIYTTLNAKNQLRAPTEFGVCLRAPGAGPLDEGRPQDLRCLACESERARTCWITAMRLAKYGKQLRENYRAFKNKQVDSINPKEYNSYTVPNESVRSRVAMDFTGSVGRIVEDPKEARAIAVAEGCSWKRRWRASPRPVVVQGIESGVHITQPWFHSGMNRDQATQLVNRHGTVDGVFLVRESRSNPGSFVLTFKCGGKVIHTPILPVMDPARDAVCYTLDSGVTKFYDLLQLVEFYQLNAGCLPTRLTHYLVQSPTGPLFTDKPTSH